MQAPAAPPVGSSNSSNWNPSTYFNVKEKWNSLSRKDVLDKAEGILEGVARGGLIVGSLFVTAYYLSPYLSHKGQANEGLDDDYLPCSWSLPRDIAYSVQSALFTQAVAYSLLAPLKGRRLLTMTGVIAGCAYLSQYAFTKGSEGLLGVLGAVAYTIQDLWLVAHCLFKKTTELSAIKSTLIAVPVILAASFLIREPGSILNSVFFSGLALVALNSRHPGVDEKPLPFKQVLKVAVLMSALLADTSKDSVEFLMRMTLIFLFTVASMTYVRKGIVTPIATHLTLGASILALSRIHNR